jgi:adenylate cyclase
MASIETPRGGAGLDSEIERKFVVPELPPLPLHTYGFRSINQGYIAIEAGGREIRLRAETFLDNKDPLHTLTVKYEGGLSRPGRDVEISPAQFADLWPATEGRRLRKLRYDIPHGERTIELDVYAGKLGGLIVAEVEFPDEELAAAFDTPDWFGEEVTDQKPFKNQSLAVDGMPEGYSL